MDLQVFWKQDRKVKASHKIILGIRGSGKSERLEMGESVSDKLAGQDFSEDMTSLFEVRP